MSACPSGERRLPSYSGKDTQFHHPTDYPIALATDLQVRPPGLTTAARVPRRLATACAPSARMVAIGSCAPTASACRGRCTILCATPWPGC
jgi:hypothetical protein